jgi:protein-disulfide isomerase
MNIRGIPVSGHPSASAVIVEFTDYECPYCLRHANTVLPQLRMKYEWTAQVRYAVANFPLWIHKNADTLARAAVCSIEQNRFWDLHIAMFSKTPRTEDEVLILAENLGINPLQLQTCMEGQFATDTIRRERELATALGIESTPSFVIGTTDADGKLFVKKLIIGAQPVSAFEAALADVIGLQ